MYTQFQGSLNDQSNVITSLKFDVPAKTIYVLKSIIINIVMKNVKKPYLKKLVFINFGMGLFLDNLYLFPSKFNNCPLPQYLLQYVLPPPFNEIISGIAKQINPIQAKIILNNPNIR
ncbi:hypothetical protein SDC9_174642 [bioreactor metagenome]|uniref:Uncharacterized protein n=1 Tax=bioreactor metagenome TaxID=1076179 RepID=A0A645GT68_9ZZZZ